MILIVDDSPENIFSLKALLTLHHFEVDWAISGEEALKKILQNDYFLIILDVQMPEMDGFEVAEAISGYSKSKDIPIIFLSAVNTHKRFITKGFESGAIDYVTKPFDADILLLKVKTFYRLSEQTRKLSDLEKSLREEIELRKEAEHVLERKVEERTTELLKTNERLEQSNRELQQFAYVASHDLQEPLRKIQTMSNLALERFLDDKPKLKTALEKVYSSATRLRGLITDLLSYSRTNAAEVFVKTDLNEMLVEILNDLEAPIRQKNARVEVAKIPDMEVVPTQIRQTLQNLISNALKFSKKEAPVVIRVTAERVNAKDPAAQPLSKGKYCRIGIHDNGIGFEQEQAIRIFEVFQRLNIREDYEGNGIGLSIVKRVVERHDGMVYAEAKEGEGAVFFMILPIAHQVSVHPVEK